MDERVLEFWREADVFARSLSQTADRPQWVFYEGPPTANGSPGIHHVEARAFKDIFPRYQTMKGFSVSRRAGWDCHGLPVELEVEKALGLSGKADIEAMGIAAFNEHCRASVLSYVDAWEAMSRRMGYWVDFQNAYRTMDASYVESVWWALKQIHDKGLLVEDYRVAPYCPRCQTPLSSHELGQPGVYTDIESPSAYVRLPITDGTWADLDADLLVWTTTPWTLVSNTAVAVHPDLTYVVARSTTGGRAVVVAEPLLHDALGEGWEVVDRRQGSDLEYVRYARPFDLVEVTSHHVVLARFVTTEDGTGLVHLAPAFGADDLAACRAYDLPIVNPIAPDGRFEQTTPMVGGMLFTEADHALLKNLEERRLLFRYAPFTHAYPHCWRCGHALLYYATPSWYIRTTAIKDALIAQNEATSWNPASVRTGRYGDWLSNNVDWALSRQRYWGTPLPIWRCSQSHTTCVGSLAELSDLAGQDLTTLDPHRPFVDEVAIACPTCGAAGRREPDVIDVWFDSGAMPFAQHGAPHRNKEEFERSYPAQFICEAIDQTRGWFYTLMAIGTAVFGESAYQNVVCVGLLLDGDGRKMSKRLGNILEPLSLMNRHGADAVRWFMLCSGSPWHDRRISHEMIEEITRRTLLTYWNTAAFQSLYGRVANWKPSEQTDDNKQLPVLDRWLRSELAQLVVDVSTALDAFDSQTAGRLLDRFIDQLSNWYVRRSRRRFWAGDPFALDTLHYCLHVLTRLLAPLVPFITEQVWQALFASNDDNPESVHLATWPDHCPGRIDEALSQQMTTTRKIVDVGRVARGASGAKTRQPLARALISAPGFNDLPEELRGQIKEELNVVAVDALEHAGTVVDIGVRPQFRALGKKHGSRTQQVAAAIRSADPVMIAHGIRDHGQIDLYVGDERITLEPDDVQIEEAPRTGWHVATEAGVTVALDLDISPELERAGIARDIVRQIQQARKVAGLDISDRIRLYWNAQGVTAQSMSEHQGAIADEVLATTVEQTDHPPHGVHPAHTEDIQIRLWICKVT